MRVEGRESRRTEVPDVEGVAVVVFVANSEEGGVLGVEAVQKKRGERVTVGVCMERDEETHSRQLERMLSVIFRICWLLLRLLFSLTSNSWMERSLWQEAKRKERGLGE